MSDLNPCTICSFARPLSREEVRDLIIVSPVGFVLQDRSTAIFCVYNGDVERALDLAVREDKLPAFATVDQS